MAQYINSVMRLADSQKITANSSESILSGITNPYATLFRFAPSVDVWITSGSSTISASSTGASGSHFIPADTVEYILINPQDRYVAVRADSTDGFLSLSEAT